MFTNVVLILLLHAYRRQPEEYLHFFLSRDTSVAPTFHFINEKKSATNMRKIVQIHTKLDFSLFSQKNVASFDISMDLENGMQIRKALHAYKMNVCIKPGS